MKFVAFTELASTPNVIVDGAAAASTVLALSHWPRSGTPEALRADTSTEIVFNYLGTPRFHVDVDVVSNNHFDEDGLVGIFALVDPVAADRHRDLLIDVAQAGDFGSVRTRQAARIAFVLSAYAEADQSPLSKDIFDLPYPSLTGELYVKLLELFPRLLDSLDAYRSLWEDEDERLTASEMLIERGVITIEEQPDLDLAIVRLPDDLGSAQATHVTKDVLRLTECHPYALHTRTPCTRLIVIQGERVEVQYRYEGWVQFASRRPAARVDLSALADELSREEAPGGTWRFDGVDRITPKLRFIGDSASAIPADSVTRRVIHALRTGAPAWNPYE